MVMHTGDPKDFLSDQPMDSEAKRQELMFELAAYLGEPITDRDCENMLKEISEAGFVLVPKEPTEAMLAAVVGIPGAQDRAVPGRKQRVHDYKAMIAAAEGDTQ